MIQSTGGEGMLDIKNYSIVAVRAALMSSNIEEIMIKVCSLLATLFLLVWVIEEVKKVVIGGASFDKIQILKTASVVLLFFVYSPLIHFMDSLMITFVEAIVSTIPDPGSQGYNLLMSTNNNGSGGVSMQGDVSVVMNSAMLNGFMMFLKWVDDGCYYFFSMYIEINLFLVRVFGPIAIAFSLFPTFWGFLMTWLKMYFKYHLYGLVLGVSIILTKSYLFLYAMEIFDLETNKPIDPNYQSLPMVAASIILSYIIFNLTLAIMGFKMLDNLFGGGNIGVRGMIGGAVSTGSQIAMTRISGGFSTLRKGAESVKNFKLPK